jgi:hypothetical protein
LADLILHVYIHRYHKLCLQSAPADAGVGALNYVKVLVFVLSKGLDFGLLGYDTKQPGILVGGSPKHW